MGLEGENGVQVRALSDHALMASFLNKPGFLLARVDQICTAVFSGLSGQVTLSQAELLLLLDRIGPVIQIELARAAGVDKSTTATILDNLQASGYIARIRRKDDRRTFAVSLTAAGRVVVPDVREKFSALQQFLWDGCPHDQQERLQQLLYRLAQNTDFPGPVWQGACDPHTGVLDRSLSFLMRRVLQVMQAQFLSLTKDYGLTLRQFSLLFLLSQRDGLTQAEFSRLFGLDPATCGVIMRAPLRAGLIVRAPCAVDGRAQIARLTPAGEAVLRQVHPLVDASDAQVFHAVSPAERSFVIESLRRIVIERSAVLRFPGAI